MNENNTNKLKNFVLEVLPKSFSKFIDSSYERPEKSSNIVSLIRLIGFILSVQYFIVRPYMVPTGSMNHTIENNDFLLVNRFIYGIHTPDNLSIPFTQIFFKRNLEPYQITPALNTIDNNDIIVFRADHEEPPVEYVKRAVGIAGDSIKTVNGVIYVNNKEFVNAIDYKPVPQNSIDRDTIKKVDILINALTNSIIYGSDVEMINGNAGVSFSASLGSANDFPENKSNDEILKDFIDYSLTFTAIVKKDFYDFSELRSQFNAAVDFVRNRRRNEQNYITDNSYENVIADVVRSYVSSRTFAHITNTHNFSNIYIPKKGDVLKFDRNHLDMISNVVFFDGHTLNFKGDKYFIDNKEVNEYTVEQDYYFVIGDNRDNSLDSRNWGYVPRKYITGAPILIYFSLTERYTNAENKSWTYYIFNLFNNIRYERIGKLIL